MKTLVCLNEQGETVARFTQVEEVTIMEDGFLDVDFSDGKRILINMSMYATIAIEGDSEWTMQ